MVQCQLIDFQIRIRDGAATGIPASLHRQVESFNQKIHGFRKTEILHFLNQ